MRGIRRPAVFFLTLPVAALLLSSALRAQDQKKFLDEERRKEMDARPPRDEDMKQSVLWDAGGWLHLQLDQLDDPPFVDTRTDRYVDLRLWGEIRIERIYTGYLRLQTDYIDFNKGQQFATGSDNHYRNPQVDQAWVQGDWRDGERGLYIRLGRQFISMGSGLLYNDLAYAGQASYESDAWALRGWVGHSIIHEDDIDQSRPNPRDSHRAFFGLEADLMFSGNHRAYAMVLLEHDFNREHVVGQDWDYNANYFGLGAKGTIVAGWGYTGEAVLEFGQTASAGTEEKDTILAFALLLMTDYQFQGPMEPVLRLQYMFGSGDSDRQSVTDMVAGNESGTKDSGFLSFGFVQTGFSLFPRVSNIHILRLGGSIRPLESVELLHKMEVGVYGYLYRKATSAEPISDSRAFNNDSDIGKEVDLFLRWRIFSDLGFSLNYGCFFPGKAYTDDKARNFFSAGITYSF